MKLARKLLQNSSDGNLLTAGFSNILEKFTAKLEKIMRNFAEVLTENQSKNINRIST